MKSPLIEVCVDSMESVREAVHGGADAYASLEQAINTGFDTILTSG